MARKTVKDGRTIRLPESGEERHELLFTRILKVEFLLMENGNLNI